MNRAVVREFILGFTTATQVAGFPNRWTLSGLLNGLFGTDQLVAGTLTGTRFVLLDNAIQFVPVNLDELNLLLPYRGVANGQSLGDAAEFDFAWTGQILKAERPTSITGAFDLADGSLLLDWVDQSTHIADDTFDLIIRSAASGGGSVLRGPMTVKPLDLARTSSTPPLVSVSTSSDPFFPDDLVTSLSSTAYDWIAPGGFTAHFTKAEHNGGNTVAIAQSAPFNISANSHLEMQVPLLDIDPTINENILPSFMGLYSDVGDYAGWFRGESITELLEVTASAGGVAFPAPPVT